MRYIYLIIWSLFTIGFCYILNKPIGKLPAIGKIISPSHGFWRLLEGDLPQLPDEVINEHLKDEVTVVWDEHLIPHIYAQNDEDLYFVQGYITASLRLWQMDFQTRAAEGRLSELVGEAALEYDLQMRRKGMELGTKKIMAATMQVPQAKISYEQYAKGVNSYLNTLKEKDWPLEYRLLGMQPEPWSVFRTLRIANFMANRLNSRNYDIEYSNFVNVFSYNDWKLLFGGYDTGEDPIVNAPGSWDFKPVVPQSVDSDIMSAPSDLEEVYKEHPKNGSNNWAVAPGRSATRHAILASDPHLSLSLPPLYFITHLKSPKLNFIGSFIPGVPGPIGGFNDSIAYGGTNSMRDLVDWYKVKFTDNTKTKILVDGKAIAVTEKIEEIKIKGRKSIFDTIYYSPFGVIANHSKISAHNNEHWAYRWIGQDTSRVAVAILEMAQAKNWRDFVSANDKFNNPHLNWAYADAQGNIGMRVAGTYLARQENEGLFLRDGTKSANVWKKYIPLEHTIQQINPKRGFVSSANQYPADSTYPYIVRAFGFESKRNRRINQILGADSSITVKDMMQLQLDNYNTEASENLEYFLKALNYNDLNSEEQSAYDDLSIWNYMSNPELKAPAYYHVWRDAIQDLAWDELNRDSTIMTKPSLYRTHKLLKEYPDLKWWDIDSTAITENAPLLIRAAFKQMTQEINQWQSENQDLELNWANVKGTQFTHLTQIPALSQANVFVGGDAGIVNAIGRDFGPAFRIVVELDPNGAKAWGMLPGGQSGNPGSMWYTNFTEFWAKGEYFNLDLEYTKDKPNCLSVSHFKPAKK
ncbi:penicillin acylase family protein [Winogradskyella aurantia]|uniref:Penicillin acylase family protein n=1 Tax=Winogradskyella aurantia TaxID=1915063 RepID=A0A265UXQ5_9FLAO|nr:penicillin acylase family protein [Winogradskyella aurantia]OZV70095.1 hypothetical protein CA834_05610 [Winogradskyella aurantia]